MLREKDALIEAKAEIQKLEKDFWQKISVSGSSEDMNQTLERAGRVADFIELGLLMCEDAINRDESCGTHARTEYLNEQGDVVRDDNSFAYVAAWENSPEGFVLHRAVKF